MKIQQNLFQEKDGTLYINLWDDVTAGFSTRKNGVSKGDYTSLNLGLHVGDEQKDVVINRQLLAAQLQFPLHTWVCSEQVHDRNVQKVTYADQGKGIYTYEEGIPATDGIYTADKDILLTSCYADCVPLYFHAPSLIGLAHAGWKGTAKNIGHEMVTRWVAEGVSVEDIQVVIGPAIGACCYIVDDRVMREMNQTGLTNVPHRSVSPGQYAIDLKEINRLLLLQAGIREENVFMTSLCTCCEETLFFSHRRDQHTGRMLSFIGRKEEFS